MNITRRLRCSWVRLIFAKNNKHTINRIPEVVTKTVVHQLEDPTAREVAQTMQYGAQKVQF